MSDLRRKGVSDEGWRIISQHVVGKAGQRGRSGRDNRLFVDAVLWILRTGAPWRDLPPLFGAWNTAYQRFARWAKLGVWGQVMQAVQKATCPAQDRMPAVAFLDSTYIKVHQQVVSVDWAALLTRWSPDFGVTTTNVMRPYLFVRLRIAEISL